MSLTSKPYSKILKRTEKHEESNPNKRKIANIILVGAQYRTVRD